MLDDLLTSAKGPGVIGALLALIVLGGFVFLGQIVLSESPTDRLSLPEQVAAQSEKLLQLENANRAAREKLTAQSRHAAARASLETIRKEIASRTNEAGELADERDAMAAAVELSRNTKLEYRDRYREATRSKAVGESLGDSKSADGTIYKNAVIKAITAVGINVRHSSGSKRVPYEEFPPELQDRFQFSEDEKAAVLAAEAAARQKIESYVPRSAGTATTRPGESDIEKWQREVAGLRANVASFQGRIAQYRSDANDYRRKHAIARAKGNTSAHLASATRADNDADNLERAVVAATKTIRELEEKIAGAR